MPAHAPWPPSKISQIRAWTLEKDMIMTTPLQVRNNTIGRSNVHALAYTGPVK